MVSAKYAIVLAAALLTASCGSARNEKHAPRKQKEADMTTGSSTRIALTSTAFKEGEAIPRKYTCDGQDISPPIKWDGVPAQTKSLALIADDPDAPMGTWVHWVIFNIPPQTSGLPENVPPKGSLPEGALQGKNDFRNYGYGGPCPPGGTHRYYFKLYALDTLLTLPSGSAKSEVVKAMQGHVIGEGELMGKYSR